MKSSLGEASGVSHRALFSYDIEPKLPMIKSPTLLMHGGGGPLFARQAAVRKTIPGCQEKTLENLGSFPFWEKPEEIANVIVEFLQKVKQVYRNRLQLLCGRHLMPHLNNLGP